MSKYIVTITPPTPNGDLHLGHLSGPFLAGDICARTLRQQGHDVLLLSYSDDYQSYLLQKARKTGGKLEDIAFRNAAAIVDSLKSINIHLSHFLQAYKNPFFLDEVNRYFSLVEDDGGIVSRDAKIPYCYNCDVYGYEGFGRATCNYCGSPSDASQCEVCASVPEMNKMGIMRCTLCDEPMKGVTLQPLSWQIGQFYPQLRSRYRKANHRSALAEYLAKTLQRETDEWPLTRPGEPAIPLQRYPDQPIHTWFSGLAGYRATLREYLTQQGEEDQLEDWWHPDTKVVHFLGFDCTYSHVVAYAALFELEPSGPCQLYHFTNRFLKLDGEDFSTSRNHTIWIREISESYPVDAIRFYTALKSPEDDVNNFSREDLQRWFATHYVPRLANGNWKLGSHASGRAPSNDVWQRCQPLLAEWQRACALETFFISAMAGVQMRLLDVIDQAPAVEQDHLWLFYSHLGQSIHPKLSAEMRAAISEHCPNASSWLETILAREQLGCLNIAHAS